MGVPGCGGPKGTWILGFSWLGLGGGRTLGSPRLGLGGPGHGGPKGPGEGGPQGWGGGVPDIWVLAVGLG